MGHKSPMWLPWATGKDLREYSKCANAYFNSTNIFFPSISRTAIILKWSVTFFYLTPSFTSFKSPTDLMICCVRGKRNEEKPFKISCFLSICMGRAVSTHWKQPLWPGGIFLRISNTVYDRRLVENKFEWRAFRDCYLTTQNQHYVSSNSWLLDVENSAYINKTRASD